MSLKLLILHLLVSPAIGVNEFNKFKRYVNTHPLTLLPVAGLCIFLLAALVYLRWCTPVNQFAGAKKRLKEEYISLVEYSKNKETRLELDETS
ncbi:unnamed protein product [Caenorhabditis brenneri]